MPRRSQEDRSRATKAVLVDTGRTLFAEKGYSNVSAEEIVVAAGVTRGALHHHFGDKRGLFVAVLEQMETEVADEVASALPEDPTDLWGGMALALARYLDICQRPEVIQLTLTDAPAVLGWTAWREMDARHGLGLITEKMQAAAESGLLRPAPIPMLAQLVLSAVIETSLIIANAQEHDRAAARAEAEQSLLLMLAGLIDPGGTASP